MRMDIPLAYREPLRRLAAMPVSQRRALVQAIREMRGLAVPDELVAKACQVTGMTPGEMGPIIGALFSMRRAAYGRPQFIEQVSATIKLLDPTANADWTSFEHDLSDLLGSDASLAIAAKAQEVRSEFGQTFCTARILTDIRPVFGTDPAAAPLACAVVHTLRLGYHENSKHKNLFVALSNSDLHVLRNLIDRALKKEGSLRNEIQSTSMRLLEPEKTDAAPPM